MYLNKTKKIDDLTSDQIFATGDYIDFLDRPEKYKNYTFEDYCRKDKSLVVQSAIDKIKENYEYDYSPAWAEGLSDYKPSYKSISKNIAYWRKANAIHNWFVENVQNGIDDCDNYEVDEYDLRRLLDTVNTVLESSKLVDGKVYAGTTWTRGGVTVNWKDGKVIEGSSVAKELLPTCSGFFFGGTEYDEWYYKNLEYTKERIEEILEETDFDNWIVYYASSW